jgi:hypothetical protein
MLSDHDHKQEACASRWRRAGAAAAIKFSTQPLKVRTGYAPTPAAR